MKSKQESKQDDQSSVKSNGRDQNNSSRENTGAKDTDSYEEIADEAEKSRTRKPGSQSNSGNQHNNGRGGGK